MVEQVTGLGAYGGVIPLTFYGVPFMSALSFTLQLAGPITTVFVPPFPSQQCHVSDQGVVLVVQVLDSAGNPVNLRLASEFKIITVRPSGTSIETVASFATNGLDGRMELVTSASSPLGTGLDEFGIWYVQGKVKISGSTQFTAVGAFSVAENLGA